MSLIRYGAGDNLVELKLTNLDLFEQRPEFDASGTDYECTHFRAEMTCIFNPKATTTQVPGGDLGFRARAAQAIAFLRHRLSIPRQPLLIQIGNDVLLQSPPGQTEKDPLGNGVDAKCGPKCYMLDVLEFHGSKTAVVRIGFETWLTEPAIVPHVLLSNRWSMQHDLDDLQMCRKVVQGRAVFNREVMGGGLPPSGASTYDADDFRKGLHVSTPDNFQRVRANWWLSEDGNAIEYVVVDEEQYVNLGSKCPASRVEGWYSSEYGLPSLNSLLHLIPHMEVLVVASGPNDTPRQNLADFAIQLALTKIRWNATGFRHLPVLLGRSIRFALRKNEVTVHLTAFEGGASAAAIVNPFQEGFGDPFLWKEFIDPTANFAPVVPFGTIDNPSYNGDFGTRGTYLNKLMAAALLVPDGAIGDPQRNVPRPASLEFPAAGIDPTKPGF